jgi:hypothetical protein
MEENTKHRNLKNISTSDLTSRPELLLVLVVGGGGMYPLANRLFDEQVSHC